MKNVLLKNLGIGLLLQIVFNIVLFSIAILFRFEDDKAPTLIPAIVFALVMSAIVYGLLKWLKPTSQKEAFGYSLSWAGIVFAIILIITIANETTGVYFGYWFNWLVFGTMAMAPFVPGVTKKC